MNIPKVAFPAADPVKEAVVALVAEEFEQVAYVYLFLILVIPGNPVPPIAKIPRVELPAADPHREFALDEAADPLVSVEYVYLFLVELGALLAS